MSNAAPTLYIITAYIPNGPTEQVGYGALTCYRTPGHSCALSYLKDETDPEFSHSTVDLGTVNKLAAESDDPAATLAAWGIWTTTDPKKARRALSRARKSAPGRWRLPKSTTLAFYAVGS